MAKWIASLHPRGRGGRFTKKGSGSRKAAKAQRKRAKYNAKQNRYIRQFDAARKVAPGSRSRSQKKAYRRGIGDRDYVRSADGDDSTRLSRHVEKVTAGQKIRR